MARGLRSADVAIERAAKLGCETVTLARKVAKEGTARRQGERERDKWRVAAQRLDAELRDERERTAGIESLLTEARDALEITVAQAKTSN